ncbi:hypothetical protein PR202_gb14269 [Eleusine coracana subsp. coracana]|uniref:F-box protein AT5G49610-like beta-propeller domain-containing protein n=1 Tax=Eleusine coracana subsp. coracana TaxID=191504 RepID=A0AAV5EV15_ELECO|nr:hypothetical protein PR202_gb14269 [Eleusine coracana subsp. coracana]
MAADGAGAVTGHDRAALPLRAVCGRFLERPDVDGVGNLGGAWAVSAVLGDDDLLCEVLVRVGFPNCLVRASLVCKAMRQHGVQERQRFVPMPQPNELESVVRRARSHLELDILEDIWDCWNGCIATRPALGSGFTARWPLHPTRARLRLPEARKETYYYYDVIFPFGDNHDQLFCLQLGFHGRQTVADVYKLSEDGVWVIHISAITDGFQFEPYTDMVLVGTKICMLSVNVTTPMLVLLDITSSTFLLVELSEKIEGNDSYSQLSCVDDLLYLILVKGVGVHVWTRQMDGGNSWSLINSFCLHEICNDIDENSAVELCTGGMRAELAHLCIGPAMYLLDCKHKTLQKVYDLPSENYLLNSGGRIIWRLPVGFSIQ